MPLPAPLSAAAAVLHRLTLSTPHLTLRQLRSAHANFLHQGLTLRVDIANRILHLYTLLDDLPSAQRLFSDPSDAVAATSILAAHAATGKMPLARAVFDSVPANSRDLILHNAMVAAYARVQQPFDAFALFHSMRFIGFSPDRYTLTSVLSAAETLPDIGIKHCRQLYCIVVKYGISTAMSVMNALITLCMKCPVAESVQDAAKLFDEMPLRDETTWTSMLVGYVRRDDIISARILFDAIDDKFDIVWNAMISGYVHLGMYADAFDLFRRMVAERMPLDQYTYTSVLSACADAGLFRLGKSVHGQIVRSWRWYAVSAELSVNNVLVTLYTKCGKAGTAWKMFDKMTVRDVVTWNAVMSGYIDAGQLDEALKVFESIPCKNELSWMEIVSGLAQGDRAEESLKLFVRMKNDDMLKPCDYTFAGAVAAAGELGGVKIGKQLHGQLVRAGFEGSNSAGNAVVTMYAKCGAVEDAHRVFDGLPNRDYISWNCIISALGNHGHGADAVQLFEQMVAKGLRPDRITFLTVLSACNHAGLADEGLDYFKSMESVYGITPGEDHYVRLVDMLGRAKRSSEALKIINAMPFKSTAPIWEAVLAGSRISGDMDLGVYAADQLFNLIPQHDGTYILLCNIYSAIGRWEDAARVRKMMKDRGIKKEPACSWIEVENRVHVFVVGHSEHVDLREVRRFLDMTGARMRKMGYAPDTSCVLHDVDDRHKEQMLAAHSERLAIAYGILNLPTGAPVTVFKNLRMCGDCHAAVLFLSRAVGRDVVVRDVTRFHHFTGGECSCGNFW